SLVALESHVPFVSNGAEIPNAENIVRIGEKESRRFVDAFPNPDLFEQRTGVRVHGSLIAIIKIEVICNIERCFCAEPVDISVSRVRADIDKAKGVRLIEKRAEALHLNWTA